MLGPSESKEKEVPECSVQLRMPNQKFQPKLSDLETKGNIQVYHLIIFTCRLGFQSDCIQSSRNKLKSGKRQACAHSDMDLFVKDLQHYPVLTFTKTANDALLLKFLKLKL